MPKVVLNELLTGSRKAGKTRIATPSMRYTIAINALKTGNKPFFSLIPFATKVKF